MGLFDTVQLEDGVDLPEFPEDKNPRELDWQSKNIQGPAMDDFKLTADGRLLKKEVTKEKRSLRELNEKAREEGYDDWNDIKQNGSDFLPTFGLQQKVVDETWVDYDQHGTFKFYASGSRLDGFEDKRWSYEARFTDGQLDKIVLLR